MAVSATRLHRLLRRATRAEIGRRALADAMATAAALCACVLLAVAIDAAAALPSEARALLAALVLLTAAGGAAGLLRHAWRGRYEPRRAAQRLERRLALRGNPLLLGVELAGVQTGSGALRALAVEEADAVAAKLESTPLPSEVNLARPAAALAAVGATALLAALLAPATLRHGLPRLAQPWADHPPYTRLRFDVTATPQPAVRRQPLTITAGIAGPGAPVERAEVVWLDAQREGRSPMRRIGDGAFELRVEEAASPSGFYIDTPRGRSARHELAVTDPPARLRVAAIHRFPEYLQRPPAAETLANGATMRVPEGTHVTLGVESEVPLAQGIATLASEDGREGTAPLLPEPDAPHRATAELTPPWSGRLRVGAPAREGVSPRPLEVRVVVTPDEPPSVRLSGPEDGAAVLAGWRLPLTVEAGDDVAVTAVEVQVRINGASPRALPVVAELPSQRAAATISLDLRELGAAAGDTLAVSARATDNRHPSSQQSESPRVTLRVVDEAEYAAAARSRYGWEQAVAEVARWRAAWEAAREAQAALAERARAWHERHRTGPADAAGAEAAAQLADALDRHASSASTLAADARRRAGAPRVQPFETDLAAGLAAMADELAAQASAAARLAQALRAAADPAGGSQAADALTAALAEAQRAAESSVGESALDAAWSRLASGQGAAPAADAATDAPPMLGPHFATPRSAARRGPGAGAGGEAGGASAVLAETVERVRAEGRVPQQIGTFERAGVPLRYREAVEAYFERLAEEAR